MQLIGMLDSPYVRRAAITARSLGAELDHLSLSVFSDFDEIREINPLVKVPTLVCDDGTVLVDSTLIIDYLESLTDDRSLMPEASASRLRALRVIGIALIAMEKTVHLLYDREKRPAGFAWPDWIARLSQQLIAAYRQLEQEIGDGWIIDDQVSQADITVAVAWGFTQLTAGDVVDAKDYPQVAALAERAEALPEFLAVPIDG